MLNRSSLKGLSLVLKNKVRLLSVTPCYYFLTVNGIEVTYQIRKDLWTCTCIHETYRGAKIRQECYHILAAKLYMRKIKRRLENDKDTDTR